VALAGAPQHGILLENLSWVEAEKKLTPETIVVIPLGAASKEHGPHLKLKNDFILAEYLKKQVLAKAEVVFAPTVTYSFYPAFTEYPGTVSLRLETARDLIIDICRSLAKFGPRKFYVLNTGLSTVKALEPASKELAKDGIIMRYTDVVKALDESEKKYAKQEGGSHADEVETSMLLFIDPKSVDMKKAVKDYDPSPAHGLSRVKKEGKVYSPTGTWGDPTLATRDKGVKFMKAWVDAVLVELDALKREKP
jgi:creatinine amidohydrolase